MKLHYLIIGHKNLNQIEQLIKILNLGNVHFYVHIDKKCLITDRFKIFATEHKNVTLIKNRTSISWAGYSIVDATLKLIKKTISNGLKDSDYLILLSGQDFPIVHPENIYSFFKKNLGTQFIESFSIPYSGWGMMGGEGRLRYYWFIDEIGAKESIILYEKQISDPPKRTYFETFYPFGGSQWWNITGECAKYIIDFYKYNPIYSSYYKLTFAPDEMYFQTIINNSHFKDSLISDNLRFINWHSGPDFPKYLDSSDLAEMYVSDKLFARKFDFSRNPEFELELIRRVS